LNWAGQFTLATADRDVLSAFRQILYISNERMEFILSELFQVRLFLTVLLDFFFCLLCKEHCLSNRESRKMQTITDTKCTALQRKIDKHFEDSATQIELFRTELKSLKTNFKSNELLPISKAAKKATRDQKSESSKPVLKVEKRLDCWLDPKMSKRAVTYSFLSDYILIIFLIQNVQLHGTKTEKREQIVSAIAAPCKLSTGSFVSEISNTNSVSTRINVQGTSIDIECSSLKLVQFLFMELRTKLKNFFPEG
jgi:hypothetical protein